MIFVLNLKYKPSSQYVPVHLSLWLISAKVVFYPIAPITVTAVVRLRNKNGPLIHLVKG